MNKNDWKVIGLLGIFLIILFCAMFLTTSCEGYGFSENCEKSDNITVHTDWELYDSQVAGPTDLDLYFYDGEKLAFKKSIGIDGGDVELPNASYQIIACNNAAGVMLRNMDNINKAELALFTTKIGDNLWMEQPSVFVLDNNIFMGNSEQNLSIRPISIFKEITFLFSIKNYTERKVKYVTGDLSGMTIGMTLSSQKIHRDNFANQKFIAAASEESPDIYKVWFFSLPFLSKQIGQKNIKKIVTLNIEYEDGDSQSATLDLTDYIESYQIGNHIQCMFDLIVSAQNLDLRFSE